jgi:hypothetical protein
MSQAKIIERNKVLGITIRENRGDDGVYVLAKEVLLEQNRESNGNLGTWIETSR